MKNLKNLTILALSALLLTNCGTPPEEEATSKEEFEELVEQYNQEKELKALSYNWNLNEIDDEIFDCQTKEYNRMDRSLVEDFCTCKVQLLARRWDYIEYKHYSFSYEKALSDSGRLDICSEAEGSEADTLQAVKEDQAFKADENTESEALSSLEGPDTPEPETEASEPTVALDDDGFEVGFIFKVEDDENGIATLYSKFSEYQKLPNQDYSLAHGIAKCNSNINLLADLCDYLEAKGHL